MFLKLLVQLLTTEAAKALVIHAMSALAKRTTTPIDDEAVALVAKTLGVSVPVEHLENT